MRPLPTELFEPSARPWAELGAAVDGRALPWFWARTLSTLPRGREQVLVLPGFMTGDWSTWPLRRTLRALGHTAHPWGLGTNRGDVGRLTRQMCARLEQRQSSGLVHLVGWSLGGVIAREIAREMPSRVAQVITMGSPVQGGPKYTAAAVLYRRRGNDLSAMARGIAARNKEPLPVPVTAFFSHRDRVVCPAACIDPDHPHVEYIEIDCTHSGFGVSPEVHTLVARQIARHATG